MRDTDLFRQILGLEPPWSVTEVKLDDEAGRIDVWVEHRPGVMWQCPICERELTCRDHSEERTWRHLDTCQFQTHLRARMPRVDCPEHGVMQVRVPWAEARSRFTLLFERLAIDVLQQCATVTGAGRLLRLSWDEAWGIMRRSVQRGLERKPIRVVRHVGVDEKAFKRGHRYVTVVADLERSTVEYLAEDRKIESLAGYWATLTPEQLAGVEAVAMDMWMPYIQATIQGLPDAGSKIVFDRYHVMRMVNDAVDKVRRQEQRHLKAEGDGALTGTKRLWLYAKENLPDGLRPALRDLIRMNLKTGRAWAIKETLRELWSYVRTGWARRFFNGWYGWARRSRLEPIRKVAQTIKDHLENILTYCRHRITNAALEGINSRIQAVKARARGYRNHENFKTAIYFFCGGLDLYPR